MLKLRILTALILVPVAVTIVYLPRPFFMGISSLITLLAAWEWSRLSGWVELTKRFLYVCLQAIILLGLIIFPINPKIVGLGLFFWLCFSIYLIWVCRRSILPDIPVYVRTGLGWFILTFCWLALQVLQWKPFYLIFMFLIIWLADTMSYFSGRIWGKHLLAPQVSPKKTWEGLIIGLLVTFFVALAIQYFFKGEKPVLWQMIILVSLTSLITIIGDLCVSYLKRLEGLKDSGHLLPGHGGILDRIDSLLAAAPVFAGFLLLLGFAS